MIVKGKAQAASGRLSRHLARTDHNERVRIAVRGLQARTIAEALRELDDLGAAAETKRTLYHGIIAPRNHEPMSDGQRNLAVRRMAEAMGLEGQPYILVGHTKAGEAEHYHVLWSRIDQAKQRGISDSHNYRKHEDLARSLEAEFGMALTRGAHTRDKAQEPRPERTPAHWEMQQQHRTGMGAAIAKAAVTEAWCTTRTGTEFRDALSKAGFIVARGDRRDFVLVDEAGGVHSLARRIEGAKARDVRDRMADLDPDQLDNIHQAKHRQKQLREAAELDRGRGVVVMSAAERMRNEERELERQDGNRARLHHADREVSAALRMLDRLGTQTHVTGGPIAAKQERAAEAKPVQPPPAQPQPQPKRPEIFDLLDREAEKHGQKPIVVKIVPKHQHKPLHRLVHRPYQKPDEKHPR